MKIYTTYLKKLPTSILPISIATRSIPGWTGLVYKDLSPGWEIWSIGKNCGWESFKEAYTRDIIGKLDPHKVIKDLEKLSGGQDIALVCYEKPEDNCHRHLVADWLPIEVKEYEKKIDHHIVIFCCPIKIRTLTDRTKT